MLGLGVVVAAFLSAPTVAAWYLAFLNAKPAWPNKESDVNAIYSRGVSRGERIGGKARGMVTCWPGSRRGP